MYFRGIWATPFLEQKKDSFYKSDSEKSTVTMMNTRGNFRVGNVAELDSMAIELPYKVPLMYYFMHGKQDFHSAREVVRN
jgi:serine protease inhibitor